MGFRLEFFLVIRTGLSNGDISIWKEELERDVNNRYKWRTWTVCTVYIDVSMFIISLCVFILLTEDHLTQVSMEVYINSNQHLYVCHWSGSSVLVSFWPWDTIGLGVTPSSVLLVLVLVVSVPSRFRLFKAKNEDCHVINMHALIYVVQNQLI